MNSLNNTKNLKIDQKSATGYDISEKSSNFAQNQEASQENGANPLKSGSNEPFSLKNAESSAFSGEIRANAGKNSVNSSKSEQNPPFSAENRGKGTETLAATPKKANEGNNLLKNGETAYSLQKDEENQALNNKNNEQSSNKGDISSKSDDNSPNYSEGSPNSTENTSSIDNFFNEKAKNELISQFPDVEIDSLRNNEQFVSLLNTIIKNPTLAKVYSCFNSIVASGEERSREKLTLALANAEAGVGSLSSQSVRNDAFFTKEQVLRMTQEEIRRNYTEIRKSQQHW